MLLTVPTVTGAAFPKGMPSDGSFKKIYINASISPDT